MTTNEMIRRTLKTKTTKEPKYRDVLADMGIEVYDSGNSEQGFWAVRDTATGKNLVISKGYDNRVHIYGDNGFRQVKVKDLSLFDYMGYLKCKRDRKGGTPYFNVGYVNTEYKGLRCAISDGKRDIRWAERDIKEVDKKIESLMKEKEWHEERLARATNSINVARKRIDELKKAHR